MFSMRARTLSGLSSFLLRSLGFKGSRCPSAHCPSPRLALGAAMAASLLVQGTRICADKNSAHLRARSQLTDGGDWLSQPDRWRCEPGRNPRDDESSAEPCGRKSCEHC